MTTEVIKNNRDETIDLSQRGRVRDWKEMKLILDSNINDHNKRYLLLYFHAQRNIVNGDIRKAREKFSRMDKWAEREVYKNFSGFEDVNEEILSMIDLAVRGETQRDKPKHSAY